MIVDAHSHCSEQETREQTLTALDIAGVDVAVLLAPFLTRPYTLHDPASLRAANKYLSPLVPSSWYPYDDCATPSKNPQPPSSFRIFSTMESLLMDLPGASAARSFTKPYATILHCE